MATVTLEKLDDNLFEINADYEVKEVWYKQLRIYE
jgi:hypothetical protein